MLFGDAGTATALELTEAPESIAHYIMKTDGKGAGDLIVPGGGFRDRFPEDRSKCCVSMDGGHIFDFTRSRVPGIIQEMRDFSQKDSNSYDYFIFHQANEYLIKFIAAKAGISLEKVPIFIGKFGNTGAASVPLTLSLAGAPNVSRDLFDVMFLGFGVGLSWGAVSTGIPKTCLFQNLVYQREPARV